MFLSVLFLIGASMGLWRTFNALRPVRPGRFGPLWLPALITGELAIHNIAWQAVLTALFVWAGALHHWAGALALILTIVSWIGLGALFIRGFLSRRQVDGVVSEATGNTMSGRERPSLSGLIRAKPRLPNGVELLTNISYGPDARHELDLYMPQQPLNAPVVIQIHGGSWMRGKRERHARPLMHRLASEGWICAAISYRLSPAATFPDQVVDAKRAVAWIKDNIAEYGGDPGFVVTTGGSAGAHLASMVALTPGDPALQPGFEQADTAVQACVGFYGVYSLTNGDGTRSRWPFIDRYVMKATPLEAPDRYRLGSPIHRVHADAPPFFVLHGTHDSLVRTDETQRFVDALRAVSRQPVVHAEVPGGTHGFDYFYSPRAFYSTIGVSHFLTHLRERHLAAD